MVDRRSFSDIQNLIICFRLRERQHNLIKFVLSCKLDCSLTKQRSHSTLCCSLSSPHATAITLAICGQWLRTEAKCVGGGGV